ncbi:MAG: heavy metal-binding domain-containing protein [Zymomonas sp.]|nr:MAG: heavy metal-binding domain-containing protein [Zymomonas sp.]
MRAGEDLCRASLRVQTVDSGGNAVIAADVDYAEVGGQRAMLMVCMTGTAIRLHNPEVYMPGYAGRFDDLVQRKASYAAMVRAGNQLGLC